MLHAPSAVHPGPGAPSIRLRLYRCAAILVVLSAVADGAGACTGAAAHRANPRTRHGPAAVTARTRRPDLPASRARPAGPATVVLTGTVPAVLAAEVAWQLFASAPVVVVANPAHRAGLASAAWQARRAHAPMLLTAARAGRKPSGGAAGSTPAQNAASAALRAEIGGLHPRAVLAVGMTKGALTAQLPGICVVTDPVRLPRTGAPIPLARVAVLVRRGDRSAAVTAVAATARVAGATVVRVRGDDPRADPAAIAALASVRPRQVLALGASFGPARRLAARVAVAATGMQLPAGGQMVFPGRRLVALYGHPGIPALGALGQQGLTASIARARKNAALYRPLSDVPVVPAFEIIATVALAFPGKDGDYSYESTVASLRPWVNKATAAGMYVILDLQAGRANLLTQAKRYEPLLTRPNVGLALDPEWKLQPGQLPLRQIGSIDTSEINRVAGWLDRLTARHNLPQKVLVLHQFRLSMIGNEQDLDTRYDDLAILIHMDGQGTPGDKQKTWDSVTQAAPPGVFFGWKNFYAKDHPMLSPQQTMARTPAPVMISYQ